VEDTHVGFVEAAIAELGLLCRLALVDDACCWFEWVVAVAAAGCLLGVFVVQGLLGQCEFLDDMCCFPEDGFLAVGCVKVAFVVVCAGSSVVDE